MCATPCDDTCIWGKICAQIKYNIIHEMNIHWATTFNLLAIKNHKFYASERLTSLTTIFLPKLLKLCTRRTKLYDNRINVSNKTTTTKIFILFQLPISRFKLTSHTLVQTIL